MIAVIADDLTGAAELGGIGIRHGLSVEVNMDVNMSTKVNLLVIAADTRSMGQEEAVKEMERIVRQLALLKPEWIYKKVDSVLRGHVIAEIDIQLKVSGLKRALLIPANPALGRTIKDGFYFLNGQPVQKSSFAADPEFAIVSSDVKEILHSSIVAVHVKKHSDKLPESGIIVGEVEYNNDLDDWAVVAGRDLEPGLLAGASGFFTALLRAREQSGRDRDEPAPLGYPALFVSGTTFGKNQDIIRGIYEAGGPVSYLDAGGSVVGSGDANAATGMNAQVERIVNYLLDQGRAIVAIEGAAPGDPMQAARILRGRMAQLVSRVLAEVNVEELVIEGGATAYAILRQAGLRIFFPEEELAPGVVRMRAEGEYPLYVTVKPGSYEWPASVRHRLEN